MIPLPLDRVEAFEERLSEAWWGRSWYSRRNSLACSLGLCGLRWCEVPKCRTKDVRVDPPTLYVRTAKRGRPRLIELCPDLARALVAMREGRDFQPGGRLFVTGGQHVMRYGDQRRFTEKVTLACFGRAYSFHCFRHTAAVRLYRRTRDVLAVQRYLGHKSLQWTEAYLAALHAIDTGGPVAFSAGSRVLRLFDPERRAVSARGQAVSAPGQEAGSVHDCWEHAVVLRGEPVRCGVCGRVLGEAKVMSAERKTGGEVIGELSRQLDRLIRAPDCEHAVPALDELGRPRGSWRIVSFRSVGGAVVRQRIECRLCGKVLGVLGDRKRRVSARARRDREQGQGSFF